MINALLLILNPDRAWERIKEARHGLIAVLLLHVVPLLGLGCAFEAWGMVHWGKWRGVIPKLKTFSPGEAALVGAAQFVLWLGTVFMLAKLVKSLGETFHGRHVFRQTFTVVAYGLGPLFLVRFLDAFPVISPWLSWSIGVFLSIGVLYQGLPRILEPDPPHAFGLYLMSSILLLLITGLVRFVTAWYLQGRFSGLESMISNLAARLPF
jgi:hypothetical protein